MISFNKCRLLLSVLSLFMAVTAVSAQELYCNVQVSAQKIQGSNREIFQSMQRDIYEFMNSMVWTDNVFSFSEKIECNLLINLDEQLSADEFRGTPRQCANFRAGLPVTDRAGAISDLN